jgi:hypothetical protein
MAVSPPRFLTPITPPLPQPENVWVIRFINALVVRAYTDSTLKLSDSLQRLTRAAVVNVHGVRSEFTDMGRARAAAADPDAGVDRSKESGAAVGEGKGGGKEKEQAAAGSGGLHTEGKGGGVAAHTEGAESERGAHTEGGDGGVAHTAGAYFIGKLLWAKGHGLLIEYLQGGEDAERGGGAGGGEGAAAGNAGGGPSGADTAKGAGSPATGGGASCTDTFGGTAGPDTGGEPRPAGRATPVDIFGEGEDDEAVRAAAARAGVALRFRGPRDHAHPDLYKYKVFVNPSRTEVQSGGGYRGGRKGLLWRGERCWDREGGGPIRHTKAAPLRATHSLFGAPYSHPTPTRTSIHSRTRAFILPPRAQVPPQPLPSLHDAPHPPRPSYSPLPRTRTNIHASTSSPPL